MITSLDMLGIILTMLNLCQLLKYSKYLNLLRSNLALSNRRENTSNNSEEDSLQKLKVKLQKFITKTSLKFARGVKSVKAKYRFVLHGNRDL